MVGHVVLLIVVKCIVPANKTFCTVQVFLQVFAIKRARMEGHNLYMASGDNNWDEL